MIPGVQAQASVGVTAALALPLAACLVRDFASIRRLPNVAMIAAIVAVIVLTVVLRGGLTLWHTHVPWMLIGCLAVAAVGLIHYRWRRMQSLPVAFPAGRLATD